MIAIYEKHQSKGKVGAPTLKLVGMGKLNMAKYAKPPVLPEDESSLWPMS